jgi:hypothetical protein
MMKPNKVKQLMMGAFVAVMLFAGVGLTTANAQERVVRRPHRPHRIIVYRPYNPFWYRHYDPFWDPYPYTYRVVDPIAYQREQGYSEGRSEGKKDAKKGRPANPTGNKDYLKSNSLAYREAFVKGYNERYQEEMAEIRQEMSEKRGD